MAARTLYWVGGTGSWDLTTTHWSLSSGGAGGVAAPTTTDFINFDINSNGMGGGATAYTVTRTATITPVSVDMDENITFAGTSGFSFASGADGIRVGQATQAGHILPAYTNTGTIAVLGLGTNVYGGGTLSITTSNIPSCSVTFSGNLSVIGGVGITTTGTLTQSSSGSTNNCNYMICGIYIHSGGFNNSGVTTVSGACTHTGGVIYCYLTCGSYIAASGSGTLLSSQTIITGSGISVVTISSTTWNTNMGAAIPGGFVLVGGTPMLVSFYYTYAGNVGTRTIVSTATNAVWTNHFFGTPANPGGAADTIAFSGTVAMKSGGFDFSGCGMITVTGTCAFTLDSTNAPGNVVATRPMNWTHSGVLTYLNTLTDATPFNSGTTQGDFWCIIPNSIIVNLPSFVNNVQIIALNVRSTGLLTLTQGQISTNYGEYCQFGTFIVTSNSNYRWIDFMASGLTLTGAGLNANIVPATQTNYAVTKSSIINVATGGAAATTITPGTQQLTQSLLGTSLVDTLTILNDIFTIIPPNARIIDATNSDIGYITSIMNGFNWYYPSYRFDYEYVGGMSRAQQTMAAVMPLTGSSDGTNLTITSPGYIVAANNLLLSSTHTPVGTITAGGLVSSSVLVSISSAIASATQTMYEAFPITATSNATYLTVLTSPNGTVNFKSGQYVYNTTSGTLVGTIINSGSAYINQTIAISGGVNNVTSISAALIIQTLPLAAVSVGSALSVSGAGATLTTGQQIKDTVGNLIGTIQSGGTGTTFALNVGASIIGSSNLRAICADFIGSTIGKVYIQTSALTYLEADSPVMDANYNVLGYVYSPGVPLLYWNNFYITTIPCSDSPVLSSAFASSSLALSTQQSLITKVPTTMLTSSNFDWNVMPSQSFVGKVVTTLTGATSIATSANTRGIINSSNVIVGVFDTTSTGTLSATLTSAIANSTTQTYTVCDVFHVVSSSGNNITINDTTTHTTLVAGTKIYNSVGQYIANIISGSGTNYIMNGPFYSGGFPIAAVPPIAVTTSGIISATLNIISPAGGIVVPTNAQVYDYYNYPIGTISGAASSTSFPLLPYYLPLDESYTTSVGYDAYDPITTGPAQTRPIQQMSATITNAYTLTITTSSQLGSLSFNRFVGALSGLATESFTVNGSLSLCKNMGWSTTGTLYMANDNNTNSISTNGTTLGCPVVFNTPFSQAWGTWVTVGNFTTSQMVTLSGGDLIISGFTFSCPTLQITGSTRCSLQWGQAYSVTGQNTSILSLTGSGVCLSTPSTNFSSIGLWGQINLDNNTTTTRTINGGSGNYPVIQIGPTGSMTNSITVINGGSYQDIWSPKIGAHTVQFTAGTTSYFTKWNLSGTSGNPVTISSTTASYHYLVGIGMNECNADYLNISWSIAMWNNTGDPRYHKTWFAGPANHSSKDINTSGWILTYPNKGSMLDVF